MKFIHIADIHASKERLQQTLVILNTLKNRCEKHDIDFVIFAGDFWDSTITATKGSGFSDIVQSVRELEKFTKLYFIYGTPTHEPNGSLDIFKSDKTKVFDTFTIENITNNLKLVCIPEPRRSQFVSSSIQKTDKAINDYLNTSLKQAVTECKNCTTIVAYHGEVSGAVYQNGMKASSATAISSEKLKKINAVYYALGHIHLPQEVFNNAYYSGSACPKDFGETHQGSYNIVTVENKVTTTERVPFDLPTYKTLEVKNIKDNLTGDFSNQHIKLRFTCTREEKKQLNIIELSNDIKTRTGALSVKLEPTLIEEEKKTESFVSTKKSITEKMIEYAKENNLPIPNKATELLKNIEDNTLIKFAYPQHSFELISLSLRGAIGIRDGQHKEDFELDFSKFDDGVICLVGANGTGKTTIIENCHPYPCMLTRNDSLKENFYLKDSHRIITYKDENNVYYKISMLIDGKTSTGKVSYFVTTSKDNQNWQSVPEVDGSLVSYQQWVNTTFGSIDIFLRTAFFAKEQVKGIADISSTTKSERMELLSKLAGTEHLKEVSSVARDKRKGIEIEVDKLNTELSSFNRYSELIEENNRKITTWKQDTSSYEKLYDEENKKYLELKKKDIEYQKDKARLETEKVLKDQYSNELLDIQKRLNQVEIGLQSKDVFEKINKCNNSIKSINANIAEERLELKNISEQILKSTENEKNISKEISNLDCEIKLIQSQVIEINEICPTCGSPISAHKKQELLNIIKDNKTKLDVFKQQKQPLQKNLDTVSNDISSLRDKCQSINQSIDELETELKDNETFVSNNKKLIEMFPNYDFANLKKEHKELSSNLEVLNNKILSLKEENLCDVSELLKTSERSLQDYQTVLNTLSVNIKTVENENAHYQKELSTAKTKKSELKTKEEEITAYLFIENAFSNNGIPAIELRNSAPEIALISNKILSESYGNKFEIRFGSTSELKQKRKANEDFNIIVYDTENGDEKTIDLVSSGERIWIKQALFYAFSIVQMNRTGFNFRTRFIDESDGSLDGVLRPKYLQMVTSAHKIADARLTMLITHSQEVKDIAEQIIEI